MRRNSPPGPGRSSNLPAVVRDRKGKEFRNPIMNCSEKSDPVTVARKPANNGPAGSVESGERRAGPKDNQGSRSSCRAQKRGSESQAADQIRQAVMRNPDERRMALVHRVTISALHDAFHLWRVDAAAGVDGVTRDEYADGLDNRLVDLHGRGHGGAYQAPPPRRVYKPKEGGGQRPLGIASLEDKSSSGQ